MSRFLIMLEVSQKQAYIFGSNKLEDNIVNSAIIAKCLSPEYLKDCLVKEYDENTNLVYSGGGHTVLEYDDEEVARRAVKTISLRIYKDFAGLEIFAKIIKYDMNLSPQENLKNLTKELEKKKAIRISSFHHGSFGIEKIDSNTRRSKGCTLINREGKEGSDRKKQVKDEEYRVASKEFTPDGYSPAYKFENLGGCKGTSNFIAVVHIDGNGMGKRVSELYDFIKENEWEEVKSKLKEFSDGIDEDFKGAYKSMVDDVKKSIEEDGGNLNGKLNLSKDDKQFIFPVRRIITAGDDICFVTEGRIGIECARLFIEKLTDKNRKNCVDNKGYSACAGVAIVHQKYPFYKAYEIAEMLCSNAKKEGARISPEDDGRNVSLIDWHIEFGELKDGLEEIKTNYISDDGNKLSLKPYIVDARPEILNRDKKKKYESFIRKLKKIQDNGNDIGKGKIKELRSIMKKGEVETNNYLKFYKLEGKLDAGFKGEMIAEEESEKTNSLFDAIEVMDTFLFV